MWLWSLGLGLLFLAACATTQPRYVQPTDYIAPMDKLRSAVDAELHNPYATELPAGKQLWTAAIKDKPELREAFSHTTVIITNQNRYAVLLLVSPTNHNVAWYECATWPGAVVKSHYLSNPPTPAAFTIRFPENLR